MQKKVDIEINSIQVVFLCHGSEPSRWTILLFFGSFLRFSFSRKKKEPCTDLSSWREVSEDASKFKYCEACGLLS